ncbi:hypothetical protein [Prosthecobacter sp.]|uniref:hypothetical protein n=1 Tax=Prosthecobacter sp. TaxID=1965333 RepID=UPI001DCAA41C|nr:hypothetical protein [Prosthecobacter sp.]MCB1277648.1 hypothetical protein [Prosthecobacter sp.]
MKPLIVIILAIAVGYVSYEYVYPPFADAMKFTKHVPKPEPKKEVVVAPPPKPVVKEEPKIVMEPKPEPKPEMKPEEPKPEMPKAPEPPPPDPNAFVAPVFPPVDELTQNWAAVPKGFFTTPKQVTMKKDLELKMQMGKATASTTFKSGTKIFVMGQEGANLVVGASAGSPMRGLVAMDDTDFKEVFEAAYEQVKVVQTENARRAHEYKLAAAERAKNAPAGSSGGGGGSSNDKPEKDADGAYPLLLASMKAGEVTEIKPDNVKSWGDAAQEKIDGTDYWTVNVKYETQTMFGKFETEAQARIKNGRVDKWVYTGSGEVVP